MCCLGVFQSQNMHHPQKKIHALLSTPIIVHKPSLPLRHTSCASLQSSRDLLVLGTSCAVCRSTGSRVTNQTLFPLDFFFITSWDFPFPSFTDLSGWHWGGAALGCFMGFFRDLWRIPSSGVFSFGSGLKPTEDGKLGGSDSSRFTPR